MAALGFVGHVDCVRKELKGDCVLFVATAALLVFNPPLLFPEKR